MGYLLHQEEGLSLVKLILAAKAHGIAPNRARAGLPCLGRTAENIFVHSTSHTRTQYHSANGRGIGDTNDSV